jgi:hypothetical protein
MILTKTPVEVGFPAEFNWTAGLIVKFIKREYGLNYSIHGITGIFERLGLSYTRPTYVLAAADKQKQQQFVKDFVKVKKICWRAKSSTSFSVMNQMIRDYQAIHQTWFKRGKQQKIKTYGKHRGVKLIGVLNYESGKIYCEEHETYDKVFLRFSQNILLKYPNRRGNRFIIYSITVIIIIFLYNNIIISITGSRVIGETLIYGTTGNRPGFN